MMEDTRDFEAKVGKRVRALREKFGYSREKLSELAEVSPKFIYEIEMGRKGMSAYTLYNISRALSVSCDYLLTGKSDSGNLECIETVLSSMGQEEIEDVEEILRRIAKMIKRRG